MGSFPGVEPSANWTRVQGVLMWALSRNSEWGRVTAVRAMLASPGLGGEGRGEGGVAGVLGGAGEPEGELGGEGEMRAVGDLEVELRLASAPSLPKTWR